MAKAKELIKAASIARYTDKATGKFLGFGVKSNRGKGYYEIHCTKTESGAVVYTCDCEAKEWGHPVCNHIKAVVQLVEARKALQLDAAAVVASLIVGEQFAQDLAAHIDDELAGQDDEPTMEAIAAEIIEDELVRAEVEALPDADSSAMDEIDAMQAEKKRKLAVSVDERMSRAPMTSNDGFSLLMPEKPQRKSRSAA